MCCFLNIIFKFLLHILYLPILSEVTNTTLHLVSAISVTITYGGTFAAPADSVGGSWEERRHAEFCKPVHILDPTDDMQHTSLPNQLQTLCLWRMLHVMFGYYIVLIVLCNNSTIYHNVLVFSYTHIYIYMCVCVCVCVIIVILVLLMLTQICMQQPI